MTTYYTFVLWVYCLFSNEKISTFNFQTLLKKHKEISDELKNYESTIKALHDQADALGEDDRESRTGNISVSVLLESPLYS